MNRRRFLALVGLLTGGLIAVPKANGEPTILSNQTTCTYGPTTTTETPRVMKLGTGNACGCGWGIDLTNPDPMTNWVYVACDVHAKEYQ